MDYLKKYGLLFLIATFISCGSGGHIQFYDFIVSKAEAKKELIRVINSNGKSAPAHWNGYETGKSRDDIFIYFKDQPQEVYLAGFNDFDDQPGNRDKTTLALVGVFDGKIWRVGNDLSRAEERRAKKRFEAEILSKMKFFYSEE